MPQRRNAQLFRAVHLGYRRAGEVFSGSGNVFGKVKSLFGKSGQGMPVQAPSRETVLAPDQPFYAVGDIHGCADLLKTLLDKIGADAMEGAHLVFVGDYADRGPKSAAVLEQLFRMQTESPETVTCLMGNHEKMMLEFIDDPLGKGARWLVNGGTETLESYGITGVKPRAKAEDAMDAADALEDAMPRGLQDWLRNLPLTWSSGNMHCVHAAMDPGKPVSSQRSEVMLWGHRDFMAQPREDDETVVYGHVIAAAPSVCDGRISVDTGAYKSGRLTAAAVSSGACRFLTT